MAAFPRDQDLSEDSSLPIITGHELVSTFPDYFHSTRSQYDIIGLPGFEGVELVPPESTTNCNNIISILADYDGLTPLLERAFQPNVHGGCFPDLLRSEEQESCNGHQSAALILSDSRKPAIVGSEDQWQQVPDPQQRQIRDVGGTNPKQPSPERDPSMPPAPEDCKKRKSDHILSFAAVEDPKKSPPTLQEDRTRARRPSGCGGSKCHNKESPGNAESRSRNAKAKANAEPPTDYIHVRARRGQATDSHSLAERARREKISERMRKLQDLVPGCDKVTGKAVMLDEIINYIQSLQNQVEFLSMKLASLNPRFSHLGLLDGFLEELLPLQGSGSSADPSEVYEAAANLAEGHHQAPMQDQMPCALDMAFPTTISAYNSLTDRPRRPSIDGRAVGISQCGCNTIR